MGRLPVPPPEAIIHKNDSLYVCLASFPLTRGHSIVAWNKPVKDLNLLDREEYDQLMRAVEKTRAILMDILSIEKVYLLYMDEVQHVHWHLIPRYKQKGYTVLNHQAEKLEDFHLAARIKKEWERKS